MQNFISPDLSPRMKAALTKALAQPAERVRPLLAGKGEKAWLKRVEYPKGLMRLQKGDGAKAFMAERDALLALRGRNLPVAEPLALGDDYVLLVALPGALSPPRGLLEVGRFKQGEGMTLRLDSKAVPLPVRLGYEHGEG